MCGIFAYLSNKTITLKDKELIKTYGNKISHRGPDQTNDLLIGNDKVYLMFHRLKIVDLSSEAMQPFSNNNGVSICNGEIYNHNQLRTDYNLSTNTTCDCEILIPLMERVGIHKLCELFDGVFAFVFMDTENNSIKVARDPIGIRSLYYGVGKDGSICLASEMKSIPLDFETKPYPPGCYSNISFKDGKWQLDYIQRYYHYYYPQLDIWNSEQLIVSNIRKLLESAVDKRMMSNRPIGCLLSGGLDSSIITALVSKKMKEQGMKLKTFSVGLTGSEDLKYAKELAEYLDTEHYSLELTEDEMFNDIKNDIYQIESYDTTTIRASTPMFILSKWIKANTDVTVIFSGEGSDEASGSYMYFHNAPSNDSFQKETINLLEQLHRFDVLRCDKSTAGAGLEVRVPFLDKDFLRFYMSLDPKFKIPGDKIEKRLLRMAFTDLLPESIAWRKKEGMSDGVSSQKKSWFSIIQERVDPMYSDSDIEVEATKHNPPKFKEARYYRDIFNLHYGGRDKIIPHYWLPKWSGDIVEPSARILDVYSEDKK